MFHCYVTLKTFWRHFDVLTASAALCRAPGATGVKKSFNVHVMRAVYSWSRDRGRQIYFQSQNARNGRCLLGKADVHLAQ